MRSPITGRGAATRAGIATAARSPALLAAALLATALLAGAGVVARAAHEWRADWAAPQSFEVLEHVAHPAADTAAVALRVSVPYGVDGLGFQSARLTLPGRGWQVHAGTLRCADYGEWHLGAGTLLPLRRGVRLLAGVRVLGIDGPWPAAPCWTGTLILGIRPACWPALEVAGGLVDGAAWEAPAVAPIAVARATMTVARLRIVLDRSSAGDGDAGTTVLVWVSLGPVGLLQGYRWGVGEGSAAITFGNGRCHVSVGQRWHPALGGTPHISVAWAPGGRR